MRARILQRSAGRRKRARVQQKPHQVHGTSVFFAMVLLYKGRLVDKKIQSDAASDFQVCGGTANPHKHFWVFCSWFVVGQMMIRWFPRHTPNHSNCRLIKVLHLFSDLLLKMKKMRDHGLLDVTINYHMWQWHVTCVPLATWLEIQMTSSCPETQSTGMRAHRCCGSHGNAWVLCSFPWEPIAW